MQVLKKFGVLFLISLFVGGFSYAKTKQPHCQSCKKKIHNEIAVSSKRIHHRHKSTSTKTSYKDASIENLPSDLAPIESNNTSLRAIDNTIASKKETPTTTITIDKDLFYTRTVTKTIIPKKEESSFGSTMMDWVKDKYSCMIDVLPNQMSNVMLYRFIDDWYGVKYRMGGSTKKGVDCSAFVQTLYKYVFGLDLLRTACMQFNTSELITNPADLKEGDLVFFKVKSSRISHVGVYLRNNFFVHSASSKGVSIANLNSAYWSKYFAGGGRILPKS